MSYDLMVFDPAKASVDIASFMRWYGEQTKQSKVVGGPFLFRHFLLCMWTMNVFEAMEGAGTDNRLTEYSLGKEVIYAAFAWSVA